MRQGKEADLIFYLNQILEIMFLYYVPVKLSCAKDDMNRQTRTNK